MTSSKPPSSDIVKPPKHAQQTHRSAGGQLGHPKHDRAPFAPEQVNLFAEHSLHACPTCDGPSWRNGSLARVVQQVDVDRPPLAVAQPTSPEYWCARCAKSYQASLPAHVEVGGLLAPRPTVAVLTAFLVDIDRFATPGKLVAYFGVLPIEASSGVDRDGQTRSPRRWIMSRRGNDLVRRDLWMAALSAIRCNPAVRALYARVVAKHPLTRSCQ